jgi:hypothetical protein
MELQRFDTEVCLPKGKSLYLTRQATINQIISEKLPENAKMSNATKDLIVQLCMQFINQVAN